MSLYCCLRQLLCVAPRQSFITTFIQTLYLNDGVLGFGFSKVATTKVDLFLVKLIAVAYLDVFDCVPVTQLLSCFSPLRMCTGILLSDSNTKRR